MNGQYVKYALKLIIDLIKVDKKIHRDEIEWIEDFARQRGLSPDDLQDVHNISLAEAVAQLQSLDAESRHEIISWVEQAASIDNDIDINERIILASIRLTLGEETRNRIQLISVDSDKIDRYDRQLVYLEQENCPGICKQIEENYDFLRQWLSDSKIDFFFFPHFIRQYTSISPFIEDTTRLLFPTFTPSADSQATAFLRHCRTSDFCAYLHRQMGEKTDAFKFKAFYLLKIQEENTGDNNKSNFICIEASESPMQDIFLLVKNLLLAPPFSTIPYEGCYRTLFTMLSEQTKTNSRLLLIDDNFYLPEIDNCRVEITGAERKTLFTLFLLHAGTGISNEAFASMTAEDNLGREVVTLYKYFAKGKYNQRLDDNLSSGNEPDVIVNLRDIGKRISHIGFIKKAFTRISKLKNPEYYYPVNQKGQYAYKINLPSPQIQGIYFAKAQQPEMLTIAFFR